MILRSKREIGPLVGTKKRSTSPPSPSRVQKLPVLRKTTLTRYNLRRLRQELGIAENKMGNPEPGLDLGTPSSITSKDTSTTDKKLDERLWANGVRFKHPNAKPPKDLTTVEQYLHGDRESQLADEYNYQKYLTEMSVAENEEIMKGMCGPYLHKKTRAMLDITEVSISSGLEPKLQLQRIYQIQSQISLRAYGANNTLLKPLRPSAML